MTYDYALDLRVARRKAGLTQADCAHLLGVDASRISRLEAGKTQPTLVEFSILCLVFMIPPGRAVGAVYASEAERLGTRLESMPKCPETWRDKVGRRHSLDELALRINRIKLSGL